MHSPNPVVPFAQHDFLPADDLRPRTISPNTRDRNLGDCVLSIHGGGGGPGTGWSFGVDAYSMPSGQYRAVAQYFNTEEEKEVCERFTLPSRDLIRSICLLPVCQSELCLPVYRARAEGLDELDSKLIDWSFRRVIVLEDGYIVLSPLLVRLPRPSLSAFFETIESYLHQGRTRWLYDAVSGLFDFPFEELDDHCFEDQFATLFGIPMTVKEWKYCLQEFETFIWRRYTSSEDEYRKQQRDLISREEAKAKRRQELVDLAQNLRQSINDLDEALTNKVIETAFELKVANDDDTAVVAFPAFVRYIKKNHDYCYKEIMWFFSEKASSITNGKVECRLAKIIRHYGRANENIIALARCCRGAHEYVPSSLAGSMVFGAKGASRCLEKLFEEMGYYDEE